MNIFDFDQTLYKGDSTFDFWMYVIRERPSCLIDFPAQLIAGARYAFGRISKEDFKEVFYRFLRRLDNPHALVHAFWSKSMINMNEEVLSFASAGDLVVSASPRFLVEVPCNNLGLNLIASEVDIHSGCLESPNCYGEEKIRRIADAGFLLEFERGFSDSLSDSPLLALAKEPYLVTSSGLKPLKPKSR